MEEKEEVNDNITSHDLHAANVFLTNRLAILISENLELRRRINKLSSSEHPWVQGINNTRHFAAQTRIRDLEKQVCHLTEKLKNGNY